MNLKITNQKAISQKAVNRKVFKSFFVLFPPNNTFKVEKTLFSYVVLPHLSCRSLHADFLWIFLEGSFWRFYCALCAVQSPES